MRLGFVAMPLAALVAAGCSVGGAPDGVVADCTTRMALPPAVQTDILFVIDDSGSMAEEQEKVASELEGFVSALATGPVTNDFRVGVVTTAVSQHARQSCDEDAPGALVRFPEASGRLQPATLPGEEEEGPRVLDWQDPDLIERFSALVRRGTGGTGQEMGLEAMRLALTEANPDFLRPGARLLVVVVTDEDDCSDPAGTSLVLDPGCFPTACEADDECGDGAYCVKNFDDPSTRACIPNTCESTAGREALEPVERYVELLQNLDDGTGTGRTRETFLAVIGPVDPESGAPTRCRSATDEAYGVGVRYAQAVEAMGERGLIASICSDDFGVALTDIARLVEPEQVVELDDAPDDGRLLQVKLRRVDGSEVLCRHGEGFTFEPATDGAPARITLEGTCRLQHGDRIAVDLFCAG